MTAPTPPTRPDLEAIRALSESDRGDLRHNVDLAFRIANHIPSLLDYALSLESELARVKAERDRLAAEAREAGAKALEDAADYADDNRIHGLLPAYERNVSIWLRARAAELRGTK